MIFGVGQAGIYLTNPLECLPEQVRTIVMHKLCRFIISSDNRHGLSLTGILFL